MTSLFVNIDKTGENNCQAPQNTRAPIKKAPKLKNQQQ